MHIVQNYKLNKSTSVTNGRTAMLLKSAQNLYFFAQNSDNPSVNSLCVCRL